ncbi:MAG TPA: undecaprenyl-diphosphate phosphatase [Spirochaetota bacterium]|nr:undecaprenyl-diphosphate phosphatase [Spirochaetota bacterium]
MAYSIVIFCILGIIQGVTEFLPVSSSGHLALLEAIPQVHTIFGAMDTGAKLFFNVALHLASLAAIIIFYYNDIIKLVTGTIAEITKKHYGTHCQFACNIIVASIPAAMVGLFLNDVVETSISSPALVAGLLIINGIMLIVSNKIPKKSRKCEEMGILQALLIGLFQAVAILPGISRSGSTIVGGLLIGLKPEEAGKFSFLMAIPVIAGAGLLELRKLGTINAFEFGIPVVIAMAITFIAALASLKLLVAMLKSLHLHYFGYYTIIAGVVALIILLV